MRISVIIPAYDREATIGAALSSALLQTWTDTEVVVVDDGSTDGTADVVEAVSRRDPRARLLRQDNAGAAAARNSGMAQATGDLITFLDSDDLIFDEHLQRLYETWREGGRGIATANAHYLTRAGLRGMRHTQAIPAPRHQRLAMLQSNFCSPMSLFPAQLVRDHGGMDTSLVRCEDWEFWLRAVFHGYPVAHQREPLAIMRRTHSTATSDRELVWEYEDAILRRWSAREDLRPAERAYLSDRLAAGPPSRWHERADVDLLHGRYAAAAHGYRRAAHLAPHERPLALKSWVLRPAPRVVGPLLRRRHERKMR